MKISKRQLQLIIREAMAAGPDATPGQAISTADNEKSASGFSPEQKAAIGFMNNSMGESPSSDQLKGMGPELQSYARDKNVDPDKLRSHLQKMLPAKPEHPSFQYDSDSGAVSSTDGKKVYGEMKITKRQLRRIIKEESVKLNEYGNPPPARDSNWFEFAMAIDVGTLDLDELAYDLGFEDFRDMDISITPRALADRDAISFITAVRNSSLAGSDMSDEEILSNAGSSAPSQVLRGRW